jgi:excisionase family DNA binding protein
MEPGAADELLTTAEVARLARVSVGAVSKWAVDGILPIAIETPGGRRRFRRSDVERFFAPTPTDQAAV